jgi:hypothetical protein
MPNKAYLRGSNSVIGVSEGTRRENSNSGVDSPSEPGNIQPRDSQSSQLTHVGDNSCDVSPPTTIESHSAWSDPYAKRSQQGHLCTKETQNEEQEASGLGIGLIVGGLRRRLLVLSLSGPKLYILSAMSTPPGS